MNKNRIYPFVIILFLTLMIFSCAQQHILRFPVVYMDLDGTALDTTGTIRPETKKAVELFKKKGGRVGVATGRTYEQAERAIQEIEPNLPVVLFNGGMIFETDKGKFKVIGNLDAETRRICVTLLANSPIVKGLILHYPSTSIPDRNSEALNEFAKIYDIKFTFQENLFNASSDSLVKVLIVCQDNKTEIVKNSLEAVIPNTSRVVISSPVNVEVLPIAISKATALRQIAMQNSFSLNEVIAFGDSGNDVEMIKSVGLGIAMCNGRPETLEVADIIIGPNYSDAIAKFLMSPILR